MTIWARALNRTDEPDEADSQRDEVEARSDHHYRPADDYQGTDQVTARGLRGVGLAG